MLQGNYVQSMHAYNDLACKACLHVRELVYACQLVGCRQMHNYIYIYSAHTIGEMLMIAFMRFQPAEDTLRVVLHNS